MSQNFVPRQDIPLKTFADKFEFAQEIATKIVGEEAANASPACWEAIGGNKRFNLHPSSNNWWLHPPGTIRGTRWRLTGRYASPEEVRDILAPLAEEFIE
jgi:hypothetical protein